MRGLVRRGGGGPLQGATSTFLERFGGDLDRGLMEEVGGAMGVTVPSEVQIRAIPVLLEQKNAVVVAPTGSGKTLSYALPLVELLRREGGGGGGGGGDKQLRENRPSALVVVPSRELCLQVTQVVKRLTKSVGKLRVEALVGGSQWKKQSSRNVLGHKVDLIVCTPGLFLKMRESGSLFSSDVRRVIFDEADTLFGKGFVDEMRALMIPIHGMGEKLGQPRQIVAVGATMPSAILKRIERIAMDKKPFKLITASASHCVPDTLQEDWIRVASGDKMPALVQALTMSSSWRKCLVFVNSPTCAQAVEHFLAEKGFANVRPFHRDLPHRMRSDNLVAFRETSEKAILVCTDAASRGLDLVNLDLVVNFDFPSSVADYLHRVGRTARMGRTGQTVSIVQTKQDRAISLQIQQLQQKNAATFGDLSEALEAASRNHQ